MSLIYLFSQDDKLLDTLTDTTGLIDTQFREELNRGSTFTFTVDASEEPAQHVTEENQVVFRDKEGDLRLFVIKEIDDTDGTDGPLTTATCEPAFMELRENIIEDRRFVNQTASVALNAALQGTRWTGTVEAVVSIATSNFYYIDSVDAIWDVIDKWGGEFKDVVEFEGNQITARKIIIKQRRGVDRGKRFEIDHDIEEIQRTVLSYPVTALYGRGSSLEIQDEEGEATGGHTRLINFADIEWKVSNGDPVDKPKGQKWVGDPLALEEYGRIHEGKLLHREAVWENGDYEDPLKLLWATWVQLQATKKPEVNYQMSVYLLEQIAGYEHEKVELGDTSFAIDRDFSRPIEIQARVIAIEYDVMDIENTAVVEMGQFLSVHDVDLNRELEDLKNLVNRPEKPITNGSYPDIKPGTPQNVTATGSFQTIQLFWDYASQVYISHYEIYGSQIADFIPTSQHLIYRGKVSAFNHEVETDEVWYYYIRAVNTRGTVGDYSNRVSAATVRIRTRDMVFGSVTNDLLADLAVSSDKIATAAIQTAHIDNLAVDNFHLKYGIIDNAHISDATIEYAKIKSLNADHIIAGTMDLVHLRAGTIDTNKIKIRGGSAIDYTLIDGSYLESRGRYSRKWRGVTTTHDVSTRHENGYLRMRNNSADHSLYFSDFGLSTYVDGEGPDGGSSGSLLWWDEQYSSSGAQGITLDSYGGVVALKSRNNRIVVDANQSVNLESWTGPIYLRPFNGALSGNNTFSFRLLEGSGTAHDGMLYYGSEVNGFGVGMRFGKSPAFNTVWLTSGDGQRWGTTKLSAGYLESRILQSVDGNFMYIGSSTETRSVNAAAWAAGNVSYIDHRARNLSVASSGTYKTSFREPEVGGLYVINKLDIKSYLLRNEVEEGNYSNRQLGVVSELSPEIATADGMAVSLYKGLSYSMLATQELSAKQDAQESDIRAIYDVLGVLISEIDKLKGVA